jgi:hypothetical protein
MIKESRPNLAETSSQILDGPIPASPPEVKAAALSAPYPSDPGSGETTGLFRL